MIFSLIDKLIEFLIELFSPKKRYKDWKRNTNYYPNKRTTNTVRPAEPREVEDAYPGKDWLDNAKQSLFHSKVLMNDKEGNLYRKMLGFLISHKLIGTNDGQFKLFSQVGVGGFIKIPDQKGVKSAEIYHKTISKLRVDFLITNHKNEPVIVVEYQGDGHNLADNWQKNDEIKKEVFKKARIELILIEKDDVWDNKLNEILKILTKQEANNVFA